MFIDSFLDYLHYEKNYSVNTISSYRRDLEKFEGFVKEVKGEFVAAEVDADVIRQWVISMMDEGCVSTSVNRRLSALRSFYKYLLIRKEVVMDPLRKVVGPKNKKPLPVFLKESEMNRLLDEISFGEGFVGFRDKMIIEMFYATGIRLAELIGLHDAQVDLLASTIKVTGKRNKQRIIPFGYELLESLKGYIKMRDELVPFSTGFFFVSERGREMSRSSVYELVKRHLSKVVSLKKRSPHVLRHTFATTMLNNNAGLGVVKELLGHSSIAVTQIYTHTTFEEIKKVYKQAHPRA